MCDSVNSIQDLQAALPILRNSLNERDTFRDIYKYTFTFALLEPAQKVLPLESAVAFWKLLLTGKWNDLDLWVEFLEEKHGKGISRDTWTLLLDFIHSAKPGYNGHDLNGAWYSLSNLTYLN